MTWFKNVSRVWNEKTTMSYLITYYHKNDIEQRWKRLDTQEAAISAARILAFKGRIIESIVREDTFETGTEALTGPS